MTATETMTAYRTLIDHLAASVAAASEAGLSKERIQAALEAAVSMVEESDE